MEFLIIGQGISGTWLSYYLHKENRSFHVIDNNDPNASSRLSAGVINPVTGRRHVEVWKARDILPFAKSAYTELGHFLNIKAFSEKTLIDFFPSAQMRQSFMERVVEKNDYVFGVDDTAPFRDFFHFDFGAGQIKPVYTAHLEIILPAWRKYLQEKNYLSAEDFDLSLLERSGEGIRYKDLTARYIIFCDGQPASNNPWFKQLPFAPNKGEMLIAEIPGLPASNLYKKGMVAVPLATPDLWWIGSDYKWEYENNLPTKEFRERTVGLLKNWLRIPFKIIDHQAGIRPATLERRPFVGLHPLNHHVGILNGMGTKGCSLAPYFANQLCDHLCFDKPLLPEADIFRFQKLLCK